MAAIHAGFLSLLRAGDRVLIGTVGYGTTRSQALAAFGRLGIEIAYVDTTDTAAVDAALAAAPTRILHVETIANPTCVVADIPALAAAAHRHGALLTVDNTFASPMVCRPLEHGADLVMESATKYLSGHSDVMAGAVVGSRERIGAVRSAQIDTGATLGPFAAFLVLRGIATVAVRMERQARTAMALATYLERQDGVRTVTYPGLPSHPQADVAARILDTGGAMLSVDLAGGREAGRAFFDALRIPERTASLGSRPHDGRPPADELPPLARCGRACRRRHHRGPAPGERRPGGRGRPARGLRTGARGRAARDCGPRGA